MAVTIGIFILLTIYFMQYIHFILDKTQNVSQISQIHCFLLACLLALPAFHIQSPYFCIEIYFVITTTFIRMILALWEEFQWINYTKKKTYIYFLLLPLVLSLVLYLQKS